jgi:hypothetical protein
MWIGRKEFEELKRRVEKSEELINRADAEIFEIVSVPTFITGADGGKYRCGDTFTTTPLVSKIRSQMALLLKELGYEYKLESQTKEPAKLVKIKPEFYGDPKVNLVSFEAVWNPKEEKIPDNKAIGKSKRVKK